MPSFPKTKPIRLEGAAMKQLRMECWSRARGRCWYCGEFTFYNSRFAGDKKAYDMAHIKSRGANGSDTIENVRCTCHGCHMAEHAGRI